jgi:hypothetical protein
MEGIWLFLWSDALPTTRSLKRTRALLLRAVRTPIDRSVYAAAGKWTGEGSSLGSTRGGEKENWPELVALTSIFSVELPGIEPDALPGLFAV